MMEARRRARPLPLLTLWLSLCAGLGCGKDTSGDNVYEFEPLEVGKGRSRAPRPKSNGQLLRTLYADAVGRPPEPFEFSASVNGEEVLRVPLDEETQLSAALDSVSDVRPVRSLLITALLSGDDAALPDKSEVADPEAYIAAEFRRVLGREPSPYELTSFVTLWERDDAVGPRAVLRALFESREYQSD